MDATVNPLAGMVVPRRAVTDRKFTASALILYEGKVVTFVQSSGAQTLPTVQVKRAAETFLVPLNGLCQAAMRSKLRMTPAGLYVARKVIDNPPRDGIACEKRYSLIFTAELAERRGPRPPHNSDLAVVLVSASDLLRQNLPKWQTVALAGFFEGGWPVPKGYEELVSQGIPIRGFPEMLTKTNFPVSNLEL